MTDYSLLISEGAQAQESTSYIVEIERFEYEVVHPMFKNSINYLVGSRIKLDRVTASRFLAVGDIKEIT